MAHLILPANTEELDEVITGVLYCYSDRQNGWYCFAHNKDEGQVGDAVYMYRKEDILTTARELAAAHNVKAKRG